MSAVIYLRSASGNREQTTWQEADCREYLRERDLTEAGVTPTPATQDPAWRNCSTRPPTARSPTWSSPTSRVWVARPWLTCAPLTRSITPESPSTSRAARSAAPSLMTASEA